ncbi:TetR/AcrR family transcriptional regulator [Glutamicibacter ardleyensis]|uniref:TetR/AcrR family transcriptional regulator n=1 Tax=Glutamicibacter ardleyensis TaxID=225894 RepID=UPI003FD58DD0
MAGPENTKRALLEAGREEFAKHGLAGARTDRIATNSGVNKQRIYAYFGSKQGMFHAVLSDALDSLLGIVPYPKGDLPPGEFLSAYLQAVNAYHAKHPDLLRLLQWEALEPDTVEPESDSRSVYYQDKVTSLAQRLNIETKEAAPILFGIIGLAAWPHIVPQLAALIMDDSPKRAQKQALQWAINSVASLTVR